jgi:hypothetical protein
LAAGIVAVLLNVILPDNEIVPKDQPPEPDADIEAQPITHESEHSRVGKEDTESTSSSKKRKESA